MIETPMPTICLAARAYSTDLAALQYQGLGISVLPCRGKTPAIFWEPLQQRAANGQQIMRWYNEGHFGNVGVICGKVSGNLIVMDLDGDAAVSAFRWTFPDLIDTYTVTSGSGHGQHVYLYVEELPPTTRVTGCKYGNVELRSNGAYVVAPPSIHPDTGKPYTIANALPIMRVAHLRDVVKWIKDLIAEKHGGTMPPPVNATGKVKEPSKYAAAALADEVRKVSSTVNGVNNQLNLSAFKLGQLVAAGRLDRITVENALWGAAIQNGYVTRDGASQTRRTIASGINGGMKKPRTS